jgi:hypothetical protein
VLFRSDAEVRRLSQGAAGQARVARDAAAAAATGASDAVTEALSTQASAQRDLDRARAATGGRAVTAERAYESAVRSTISSLKSLEDAQDRLNRAREDQASGLTEARARLRVLEAEESLQDARSQRGSGDAFFEARAAVQEQEAIIELAEAQRDLGEVQSGTNREIRDAEDAVSVARRAYEDAARSAREAREDQARAASEWATAEREAADKVIKATQDVDAALQVAADADELRRASSNATIANSGLLVPSAPTGLTAGAAGLASSGVMALPPITINVDARGLDLNESQLAEEIDRKTRFTLANRVR